MHFYQIQGAIAHISFDNFLCISDSSGIIWWRIDLENQILYRIPYMIREIWFQDPESLDWYRFPNHHSHFSVDCHKIVAVVVFFAAKSSNFDGSNPDFFRRIFTFHLGIYPFYYPLAWSAVLFSCFFLKFKQKIRNFENIPWKCRYFANFIPTAISKSIPQYKPFFTCDNSSVNHPNS